MKNFTARVRALTPQRGVSIGNCSACRRPVMSQSAYETASNGLLICENCANALENVHYGRKNAPVSTSKGTH
jgi:hypothetical protein